MATNTIDIVTSVLTQKELDASVVHIIFRPRIDEARIQRPWIKRLPEGKRGKKLNENRTLIRKYPKVFLSIICLSRTFVDTDIRPTLIGRDKNDMGLLDFVKSADLFKVKVRERTLAENEVPLLTETTDRVIAPFEEKESGFSASPPPLKKAKAGGIVILEPNPTTAGKTPAALKTLGIQSGKHDVGSGFAAHPTEDFVSSSVTPTPERECHDESGSTQDGSVRKRPASDSFVVLTSSFEHMDTDATVSPKVISSIPYVKTEAEASAAGLVNESGASFILGNETEASSSAPDDGSPIDYFYESQTIDSAIAHDIYVLNLDAYLRNRSDAEFLDRLNVNSAQRVCMMSELRLRYEHEITIRERFEKKYVKSSESVQQRDAEIATLRSKMEKAAGEAADVVVLCRRESELETAAAVKAEELAGPSVQIVELLGKVSGLESVCDELKSQVSKLEADCEGLRGEILGEAKMRAEFISIQDVEGLLAELEAYDSRVAVGYVSAVNELENVSFPILDQLEALKDSLLELLMSSLMLEGDHGEDESMPEFRSHEILLLDALAASHARAEKRKKGAY
ncbi:hypothetical protein Tco_0993375 [Tanacetum coccineum]|uniref:Uncharacterized protein n=1 Tax=Tanacetum coccineum TaxID=301880 RepID=A0ABQ5F4Q7_9ASTR